jgi:C4-dicarboxylate-specific signal transduction histidine kinase
MAEVATGVLHNVGNVLNSVNVSGQLIGEQLERSKLKTLGEVARLLDQHRGDLAEFLTRDPRGQKVVPLLERLAFQLENERSSLKQENDLIRERIEHVKVIIGQQQELATSAAVLEQCTVTQLVDAAAGLMLSSFGKHGIEIVRKLDSTPKLTVDRHLVMQILINLLANAKQASAESTSPDKQVTIRSGTEGDLVFIEISDRGVGIAPENLSKIWSHGFTTKKGGHGFGLHSSCNTARALGGDLRGTSPGPGRGAVFTLTLPIAPQTASAA